MSECTACMLCCSAHVYVCVHVCEGEKAQRTVLSHEPENTIPSDAPCPAATVVTTPSCVAASLHTFVIDVPKTPDFTFHIITA